MTASPTQTHQQSQVKHLQTWLSAVNDNAECCIKKTQSVTHNIMLILQTDVSQYNLVKHCHCFKFLHICGYFFLLFLLLRLKSNTTFTYKTHIPHSHSVADYYCCNTLTVFHIFQVVLTVNVSDPHPSMQKVYNQNVNFLTCLCTKLYGITTWCTRTSSTIKKYLKQSRFYWNKYQQIKTGFFTEVMTWDNGHRTETWY